MGKISIARDTVLRRNVAVKELLANISDPAGNQRRFVAEVEITGQLEHPGVVPIYALGTDSQGKPFYAMRLIEGQALTQAIKEYHESRRAADLRELLRRFMMACQTIAYAHNRGVIHRLAKEAESSRRESGAAMRQAAEARRAADQAGDRLGLRVLALYDHRGPGGSEADRRSSTNAMTLLDGFPP